MSDQRRPDEKFKKSRNIESIYNDYIIKSTKASQIKPMLQPWLWPGYIPLETCTLMAGKGALGKSQFLVWLTSIITNGLSFNLGNESYKIDKGNVVILAAEDHEHYTILPRLIAAGVDLDSVTIIQSMVDAKSSKKERFIRLDQDIIAIENEIKKTGNVKAIIFDPITAYMGDIRENKSTDVRNLILRLNKIAENTKSSVLLNTHVRKGNANADINISAVDEIMGSSAWANTVRMTFTFTRHHDDKDLFVLTIPKTNHKTPESLGYRIVSKEIEHEGIKIPTSCIEWSNIKINMSADEAINKKSYEERLDIDRAKDLILDALKFGSKSREQIIRLANDNDITERTLKDARQKLIASGISIIMEPSHMDKRKMIWYLGNDQKNSDK
jgi:hypothetical protein